MVSPIDTAWDVIKGEAFHPSVAGYMAAGHGGERDQATLEEMRRIEGMYGSTPLNEQEAQLAHEVYMRLEDSLSDDPHALQNVRAARPNAERENRPRSFYNRYGEYDFSRPSMDNMPPRTMRSGDRDYLRQLMQSAGRGKPVGPTGELDTLVHISDEPIGAGLNETQSLADRLDREQEARLPEMGSTVRPEPMLQRSSDTPIDTAWSILKALSRDDLRHAARTGGIPMTEARRQAYEDEGKKLSTGGGFRTMPDTEAQRMIAEQHRMRQGPFDSGDMRDANDIEIAGASIEDPSFAERYDPEPEIDPELSQYQTGTTPSNPFERAIHPIEQKRRQKAYEQHLMQQQRQRMAQARRPQMQQSSRARRPGESKNAYRKRMSRRR